MNRAVECLLTQRGGEVGDNKMVEEMRAWKGGVGTGYDGGLVVRWS